MSKLAGTPEQISSFCEDLSEKLVGMTDDRAIVDTVMEEMPSLLRQRELFTGILRNVVEGAEYPGSRVATMFDNEFLLYADPNRLYSLRLFLWASQEYTPVHDHNSWGVIGPITGEFDVVRYERMDDGSNPAYASLKEKDRQKLQPGETAFTLPFNQGIHRVGNPTETTIVSLSLYGNPLPRGYINEFDIESGQVRKLLSQRIRKTVLAIEGLAGLDAQAADQAARNFREHHLEIIRSTSRSVLDYLQQ
jgi:predicted metal-dependent enzyme (double-stranded beta helix superfamily)